METRSEFEGCLSVRDGQLSICMQSRQMDDNKIHKWCAWMEENLPDFIETNRLPRTNGFLQCREVNFANNNLGDRGGLALLRVLYNNQLAVRIIKLFKNQLGRAFASSMMDWLRNTPVPAQELHLSHNFIPREGAVDILKAVAHNEVYPAVLKGGSRQPLWLRLEQNMVEKPDELLKVAEEHLAKIAKHRLGGDMLSICSVPKAMKEGEPCPLAQVAYLINQRDHRTRVPHEAQQWKAGPSEPSRWRVSISAEVAKAPTPFLPQRASSNPEQPRPTELVGEREDKAPVQNATGPVWNGLPATEQLQAASIARASQSVPAPSSPPAANQQATPWILARGERLIPGLKAPPKGPPPAPPQASQDDPDEATPLHEPPEKSASRSRWSAERRAEVPMKAPPKREPPPPESEVGVPRATEPKSSPVPAVAKAPPTVLPRFAGVPPPPAEICPPAPVHQREADPLEDRSAATFAPPGLERLEDWHGLSPDPKVHQCDVPDELSDTDFCDVPPGRRELSEDPHDSEEELQSFNRLMGEEQDCPLAASPYNGLVKEPHPRVVLPPAFLEHAWIRHLPTIKEYFMKLGETEFMSRLEAPSG